MNGAIEEQRVAMVVVGKRRESRGEKDRDEEEASCSLPSSSLISSRNLGVWPVLEFGGGAPLCLYTEVLENGLQNSHDGSYHDQLRKN